MSLSGCLLFAVCCLLSRVKCALIHLAWLFAVCRLLSAFSGQVRTNTSRLAVCCLPFAVCFPCVLISATLPRGRLKTVRANCLVNEGVKAIPSDFFEFQESSCVQGCFVRLGMTIAHVALRDFSALYFSVIGYQLQEEAYGIR